MQRSRNSRPRKGGYDKNSQNKCYERRDREPTFSFALNDTKELENQPVPTGSHGSPHLIIRSWCGECDEWI